MTEANLPPIGGHTHPNGMDTVTGIVSATAAALPLAGQIETRSVDSAEQLPATGQPLVFRSVGWPGSITLALTASAQLPDLVADEPAAALKPAVDSGLSTAGAVGPSTVEPAPAGSTPFVASPHESAPRLFVVTVDGTDALVMAVHEGASYDRPSRDTSVDEDFLRNVHRIRGVDMELSVVIGRTTLTVAELLRIKPGQVLELDRAAGAPADVLVNGRLLASGEVVVQDLDFAVKITSIRDENAEVLG
ncbi:FliM/FliN family flagellar motor switch protein [Citricoccus sp. GCM10030269]|uniref:FliM/FliN family flagellar motor switch protein n=1 Tax=Citricoccus sp. GCM10030269 TaxID=3273388 RepID=UPI0036214288